MRLHLWQGLILSGALAAVAAGTAQAANTASSGTRQSLVSTDALVPWSVGFDWEDQNRGLDTPSGHELYKAKSYSAFVGLDLTPWFTLYGTLGEADVDAFHKVYDDGNLRWSLGAVASLWQYKMDDPEFMSGIYSLRAQGEWSYVGLDADGDDGDVEDYSASLVLNWELFARDEESVDRHPFSLNFYAGGLVSYLDGSVEVEGVGRDIDEHQSLGSVAGLELYISHNLSVGFSWQMLDRDSYHATLHYHF